MLALTLVLACAVTPRAQAASVWAANAFVDSVGANIHLHYDDQPYFAAFSTSIKARLQASKIRHVRDSVVPGSGLSAYHDHINELGAAGIPFLMITPSGVSGAQLTTFEGLVGSSIEAYEGPNELDLTSPGTFASDLASDVPALWSNRHGFEVYAPALALAASFTTVGNICSSVSRSVIHRYFEGHEPESAGWGDGGYGSASYWLTAAAVQCPSVPVVATESGYFTDSAVASYVSPAAQAKYTVRLLLEHYRVGIARTYLYELIDINSMGVAAQDGYGLLYTDGSVKPAYTAVSALLNLLDDPGTPTAALAPLYYTLSGADGTVRNMAFRKRDGTYLVAFWLAAASWNPATAMPITVPTQTVTVTMVPGHVASRVHQFQADGTLAVSAVPVDRAAQVTVSDTVQFLEVLPRPPAKVPARMMRR